MKEFLDLTLGKLHINDNHYTIRLIPEFALHPAYTAAMKLFGDYLYTTKGNEDGLRFYSLDTYTPGPLQLGPVGIYYQYNKERVIEQPE